MAFDRPAVSGSSVRGLFAAYLATRPAHAPRQVIFTAITLQDMVDIARETGNQVNAIGIDIRTQAPDLNELTALLKAQPGSVVVLTPLFGAIVDYREALAICRKYDAQVLIDNAQGFRGLAQADYEDYDVMFYSFGPIKTMTSLAGAMALVRDQQLADRLHSTIETFPQSSEWRFRQRVMKYLVLTAASRPAGYSLFIGALRLVGIDPGKMIKQATRGYRAGSLLPQVMKQPSVLQQALLQRQLRHHAIDVLLTRTAYGQTALDRLGPKRLLGSQVSEHSFWLVPLITPRVDALQEKLLAEGFHASRQTSALSVVDPAKHGRLKKIFDQVLYLPVDHTMPLTALEQLLNIVEPHS